MSDETPRLYLITPRLAASAPFDAALKAALAAGDVACVLVRLSARDAGEAKKIVRALAPLAEEAGAALVVEGDAQLAARAGADGAHVVGLGEQLDSAIEALKPDRIVGVGGLETRDDCMNAGEWDVDYLMFGGPDDPATPSEIAERAQWWAEIFNVPCVAFAHRLEEVEDLARTGAEFVALENAVWEHERGPAVAVAAAGAALKQGARA